MHWADLLTPYPGGNRRLALQGFRASLAMLDALAESAINDEETLNYYWSEIVMETSRLQGQLVTPEERQRDGKLAAISQKRYLQQKVQERDGNTCRFCGETVTWEVRNSATSGTYIPQKMGEPTGNPDEIFVGCMSCLESRKGNFKEGKDLAPPIPLQPG